MIFKKKNFGLNEVCIITSRGCIYDCAFCSAARALNKEIPIRIKSVKSVINEIKLLLKTYPNLESIRILDDLFLRDPICIEYASAIFSKYNLKWRAMAHNIPISKLTGNQLIEIKQSGCNELFIGIESGSPRILNMIHKTSNLELIKETIFKIISAGINVKGYFILGFDSETEVEMQETYNFAYDLRLLSLHCSVKFRSSAFQFRPYHGTKLYKKISKSIGKIDDTIENSVLSNIIGRREFNFTSGNYSKVNDAVLNSFIIQINNLNKV